MRPPTPVVRPVDPAEHAAVTDLTVRVYLGEGYASPAYAPQLRDTDSRAQTATVLVAVTDKGVVGAAAHAAAAATKSAAKAPLALRHRGIE